MHLRSCTIVYFVIINEVLQTPAFLIPVEFVLDDQTPKNNFYYEEWKAANELNRNSEKNRNNQDLVSNDIGDTMRGIPVLLNIFSLGTHSGKKETHF